MEGQLPDNALIPKTTANSIYLKCTIMQCKNSYFTKKKLCNAQPFSK
ncbi:hypothetical protein PAUR_a2536 [Pseudoalteromonas aurantia 208]|uniref:Orphan protein n=1 Tax=Pseudoalteromonas aurantia 208 TaxID=1314867 RepID=A0ABR9EEX2_9GAMM|nr:hypothetical protein [Pseudoalteromonas aurantia 208]